MLGSKPKNRRVYIMIRIGKTQLTAVGLALVLAASLAAGGCATKSAQSEETMSLVDRAEAAAVRAEAAASRAEAAAMQADSSANTAEMMAEKAERIFNKKMKK